MPERTLRSVRRVDHFPITLRDGTILAARRWVAEDAEQHPVPAVFEFLPYRIDNTGARDSGRYGYLAARGIAGVRVDMRGSGNSTGILPDEYTATELSDACEVIAWIAAQPWCNGSVGMTGISWGGFNSLQVAALRPPALKAIISACSTDDRYADDVHYFGGALTIDNFYWASYMFSRSARPPDPAVVGPAWRAMWLERMERTPRFAESWSSHQRRDAFWKHGSVCEDWSAIRVPVYLVGGLADDYRRAIFRMLEHLQVPRRAILGPWGHVWPHLGSPGPAIGFLEEEVKWWDHWLNGAATDVMDGPMLRAWMREPVDEPYGILELDVAERRGRWVGEPVWPSPNVKESRLYPSSDLTLVGAVPSSSATLRHRSPAYVGIDIGRRLTPEQSTNDGASLTFTGPALIDRVEILGLPALYLDVAADQPLAHVAVRLCDIAPDGRSELVTMGLLNLTHRESDEQPTKLTPGSRYRVRIEMLATSHAFVPGHRIRVGVSSALWRAWPSPREVTLSVHPGDATYLALPVRAPRAEDASLAAFGPVETATPDDVVVHDRRVVREIRSDPTLRRHEIRHGFDVPQADFPHEGLVIAPDRFIETEVAYEGEPLRTSHSVEITLGYRGPGWSTRVETKSVMTATAEDFLVTNAIEAYEDTQRVFAKTWNFRVARDLT